MTAAEAIPDKIEVRLIDADQIRARLHDPTCTLVNVMPQSSFLAGHIPKSINVPVAVMGTEAPRRLPNLHQDIVLYCAGPA